tara:strand:- start:40322 stop:40531 length:210 start_codon:yes stop_codon:yes gene_type:complete
MRQDDEYFVTRKLTLCPATLAAPLRLPVVILLRSPLVILGFSRSSSSATEPRIHTVIHPRVTLGGERTE